MIEVQPDITNKDEVADVVKPSVDINEEMLQLKDKYIGFNCNESTDQLYSKDCNTFLLKKELIERDQLGSQTPTEDDYLYPTINDPNFSMKIAEKKEFNDTQYDGEVVDVKKQAEILSNADFELAPHQAFVRNFLSFQTPYNSLLLFHGLGSGKTLSAIGVCEEMRDYVKQMGITKKIIIVASPNVQFNFRTQLFDERKLKMVDGLWSMRDTIGSKFIKEVNPMNMKGLTKERIVSHVNGIINNAYAFYGYIEFANYIEKVQTLKGEYKNEKERQDRISKNLQNEFDNRLLVIDEVHNIRVTDDTENKKVGDQLLKLVKTANNMRLLFLSATPMFNNYKEIVWLLNLMNINDRRGTMQINDVFDKIGNFKEDDGNSDAGKSLFIRKANGYVSFVRGENPYTFPFRIFPNIFSPKNTFGDSTENIRPLVQMNGKPITDQDSLRVLNLYLLKIGEYQKHAYRYVIESLKRRKFSISTKDGVVRDMPSFENMDAFGYTLLQVPLQTLIMSYPADGLENMESPKIIEEIPTSEVESPEIIEVEESKADQVVDEQDVPISVESGKEVVITQKPSSEPSVSSMEFESSVIDDTNSDDKKGGQNTGSEESDIPSIQINANDVTGIKGLERTMNFTDSKTPQMKGNFSYKEETLEKYGRIFSPDEIGKYSSKIKNVCTSIVSPSGEVADGIILIYSQWIDGGLIPMALALEEMGFTRYGQNSKSLFEEPAPSVDVRTMKPGNRKDFIPARYAMITGDPRLSPNNNYEIKGLTNEDNINGERVKVVLISKAGSEGLDFKFLRQIHILEPWYNMNRIEQIIGRGVRNFSHRLLPFEKRNVEIFLYGILLDEPREESADLYVYRSAEKKAVTIGNVTRVLKETAVDCILNHAQTNYSQKIMSETLGKGGEVTQILSNGAHIDNFKVGDLSFSSACDYMENCEYKCYPDKKIDEIDVNDDTYNEAFITMNTDKIIQKIRDLFKEKFFYKKHNLIMRINTPRSYPIVQIYAALTYLLEDTTEFIIDRYKRTGYLVNVGEYYLFQPSELMNKKISMFDREVPIDYKHGNIKIALDNKKLGIVDDEKKTGIVLGTQQEESVPREKQTDTSRGEQLFIQQKENFDLALEYAKTTEKLDKGNDNWYRHCGITMRNLVEEGVPNNLVLDFLVQHIVDVIMFHDKLALIQYLYGLETIPSNSLQDKMKKYIETKTFVTDKVIGLILYDETKRVVMSLNGNRWVKAEPMDERDIAEAAAKKLSLKGKTFNKMVGFIGLENKKAFLVFKTRNMEMERNTGARCDDMLKSKKMEILNDIVGSEKYTKANTKGLVQANLCSRIEFLMRYENIQKPNRIYFVDYELSRLYKFK